MVAGAVATAVPVTVGSLVNRSVRYWSVFGPVGAVSLARPTVTAGGTWHEMVTVEWMSVSLFTSRKTSVPVVVANSLVMSRLTVPLCQFAPGANKVTPTASAGAMPSVTLKDHAVDKEELIFASSPFQPDGICCPSAGPRAG